MSEIEIIVIIVASLIVASVIGVYIYKRIKKLPVGDCACCKNGGTNLIKKYRKKYNK